MKKPLIIIILAVVILVVGVFVIYKKQHPSEPPTTLVTTTEEAQQAAETWIKTNAKTFTFDGQNLTLLDTRNLDCTNCFSSTFTFNSEHSGYGKRDNTITLQVITPHIIEVIFKNGQLESVTTDGEFNEITQKSLTEKPLMSVDVYMGNTKKATSTETCGKVFALERIADLVKPPHKPTLELLMQGITDKEKAEGYFTEINKKTHINSFTLNGGIAHVDFSKDIEQNITKCKAETIRQQIIQTLKQFPDVKSVLITVDGKTDANL